MFEPLVTVITPVYNADKYILLTVKSVLDQTYYNIRYIVVDDGSTDETPFVLLKYMHKIDFIRQHNSGEQVAVNRGLKKVKSKYFMIVNADDPIMPECVGKLVEAMEEHPEVVCSYPDWIMIDENGNDLQHMKARDYDFKFMVRHHWCLPSVGAMYRSSVLKHGVYRDSAFNYVGDFDYWLRVGLLGPMLHVPIQLATWRKNNAQKSGEFNAARAAERLYLMDKFYSHILPLDIIELHNEAYSWACLVAASTSGSLLDKIYYTLKGISYYPKQLITLEFWHSIFKYGIYYMRRYGIARFLSSRI